MKKGLLYKRREEISHLSPSTLVFKKNEVEQDEILGILYSPGSNGLPDSSLGYALSNQAKPELRQYVESHLFRPVGSDSPTACKDADTALDMIVPFDLQLGRSRQDIGNYFLNKIKDLSKPK